MNSSHGGVAGTVTARVLIVKYGVGNVYSIASAFRRLGASVTVSSSLDEALSYDAVVFPGVGAYPAVAGILRNYNNTISRMVESGTPILGICLGLQLFFEESEEGGGGLGLLPGRVVKLAAPKLPHIGWSRVWPTGKSELLEGVNEGEYFYFMHSYAYTDVGQGFVKATARHGLEFAAVVEQYPLYGTQFHPERSSKQGLMVLGNFLKAIRR